MLRRIFLLCLTLLLGACASWQEPTPILENGRLAPAENRALAIISFTARSFDQDTPEASLRIEGLQYSKYLNIHPALNQIRREGSTPNDGGRVFIMELVPGQYKLVRAFGSWRLASNTLDNRQYINLPLEQPFRVAAGEVVYLGEVNLNMNFQPDVAFADQHKRDFYDLQSRYGMTDFSNIKLAPLGQPQ